MNPNAYREMAETEGDHWWFSGRRSIVQRVIKSLQLPEHPKILEIGAGTGGNLPMLSRLGNVQAVEMNPYAREVAQRRSNLAVKAGRLPDDLPFVKSQFDLVCLFDVLEHVQPDLESLVQIGKLLKPTGYLVLTVPAHPWLWSVHDEELHHVRRYSKSSLQEVVSAAGLNVSHLSFFNAALFPLVACSRLIDRMLGRKTSAGTSVPPWYLNALFRMILSAEAPLISSVALPFGVSLLAVIRPAASQCGGPQPSPSWNGSKDNTGSIQQQGSVTLEETYT